MDKVLTHILATGVSFHFITDKQNKGGNFNG